MANIKSLNTRFVQYFLEALAKYRKSTKRLVMLSEDMF